MPNEPQPPPPPPPPSHNNPCPNSCPNSLGFHPFPYRHASSRHASPEGNDTGVAGSG